LLKSFITKPFKPQRPERFLAFISRPEVRALAIAVPRKKLKLFYSCKRAQQGHFNCPRRMNVPLHQSKKSGSYF
jgi:hypothetical protein